MSIFQSFRSLLQNSSSRFTLSIRTTKCGGDMVPSSRQYWQEVVKVFPDPRNPNRQTYEDPERSALRSFRAQSAEGK